MTSGHAYGYYHCLLFFAYGFCTVKLTSAQVYLLSVIQFDNCVIDGSTYRVLIIMYPYRVLTDQRPHCMGMLGLSLLGLYTSVFTEAWTG